MLRIASYAVLFIASLAFCGEPKPKDDNPEAFIKSLTLAPGIEAHVWAGEKQIANPVAICLDERNRIYAAETFRFRIGGGIDNRSAMFLYFDDIKSQALPERLALYEKYKSRFAPDYFTKYSERISILEDTAGKGSADKVTVFAEGFNHPLDGPGAGIAVRDGKVYYTCIPSVWELTDANGDGVSDKREVLFEGFGVRVGISGHDLHGILWGPDGRLYWSMGDRGYNVKTREGKQLVSPGSGGVFRCDVDGSNLEVYYYGLRNPQELAFDEYGNLFTCDNNADIGDQSRFTYILEGGTSGWDMGWQMLSYGNFAQHGGLGERKPNPWLAEGLWKMRHEEQPVWILPPVSHITGGPCGLAHYPGTGLQDSYAGHFFACDYTASASSAVHAFKLDEDGAGFKMAKPHKFVTGITCTDVAFGTDGTVFVSDYMGGWHEAVRGKGRIVALYNQEARKKPVVAEVKNLVAEGFKQRPIAELSELLKHADMRVRTAAQIELSRRGAEGLVALSAAATTPGHTLSRLHGIWGLGTPKVGGNPGGAIDARRTLTKLLSDQEPRVREQAAKTLGDAWDPAAPGTLESRDALVSLLKDASPRVRTFAAIALGKMKHAAALPGLIQILKENDDKDAFLRHGAVMGLAGMDAAALEPFVVDRSPAVRLGVLLAFRRMKEPRIAAFLKDDDPCIYAEAIRAIHDVPIMGAMPQLAAELKRHLDTAKAPAKMTQLLYHRIIDANYRYGNAENAALLAEFAAKSNAAEDLRVHALAQLEKWDAPTEVDPIVGIWRPVPKRDKASIRESLKTAIEYILAHDKDKVLAKASNIAAANGIALPEKLLWSSLENPQASDELRLEVLRQLTEKKDPKLTALLPKLLADKSEHVRVGALDALIRLDPKAGIAAAAEILAGKAAPPSAIKVAMDKTAGPWSALKMGGPSKADRADQSSSKGVVATYVAKSASKDFAAPSKSAGAAGSTLPRLNDGLAAENNDDLAKNVWLDNNESRLVIDLQRTIEISRVNTFSWHRANRAPQKFTLWGATGEKPEKPDPGLKDLTLGWSRIASVDTHPLKDGGKHGSSVFNSNGIVGAYRYLLWQNANTSSGTFFSELDIYEKGQPLPPIAAGGGLAEQTLKQQALLCLGRSQEAEAARILAGWLDKLPANDVPPALHMDLIEAAGMRGEPDIKSKLAKSQDAIPKDDKLAPFRIALHGGDAEKGRDIFEFHNAACLKCHRIGDKSGSEAGPNLGGLTKRLSREKILESLVDPSAVIVPGFGVIQFKLADGRLVSGNIVSETENELKVKQPDGVMVTIAPADVTKRVPAVSPMPPLDTLLKPRELRDLIEFLSSLH